VFVTKLFNLLLIEIKGFNLCPEPLKSSFAYLPED
jgi:hypothetical protein